MSYVEKKIEMAKIEESPLGWEIDLMFLFAHCATILAEDIDMLLKNMFGAKDGFIKKKKKCLDEYEDCIKKSRIWIQKANEAMEKFELEQATYDATNKHNKQYSNVIASANELIRGCMLILDRSHCEGGDARVFKRLRSLPENGIFPESFIERFQMKYDIIPEPGDRIRSDVHGDGTLDFHTMNGNWNVKLDSGKEIILNEKMFKLL